MPTGVTRISVLGPLTVAFDATRAHPPALRRTRVRTLLALLVVHRTMSRERAIELLWPELDLDSGARNLRVTLTYLRQLLEPQRPSGEASFTVRSDATTITLHASEHLVVDLWELQRLTGEAAKGRGDADRTIAALAAATVLWRGEPLTDLGAVLDQESEVEAIRLLQCRSLVELGELRLSRGRPTEALVDAERALALDPYAERAHRLALAAALHGHDRRRVDVVARRTRSSLDELGVEPEPATRILLGQAR